jgi:hypothetical protein
MCGATRSGDGCACAQRPTGTDEVFDIDTLESVGEIPKIDARGAAIDPQSNHGFSSSRPISLPIGTGVDGAVFNPATIEVFSSQGDGTRWTRKIAPSGAGGGSSWCT